MQTRQAKWDKENVPKWQRQSCESQPVKAGFYFGPCASK